MIEVPQKLWFRRFQEFSKTSIILSFTKLNLGDIMAKCVSGDEYHYFILTIHLEEIELLDQVAMKLGVYQIGSRDLHQ